MPTKVYIVKSMVFLVTYGCESWTIKKGWAPKNWHLQTVVLEGTLENPLDCKEIKPVNPKGNQPWIFIGRTDEAPILWSPDVKSRLFGKNLEAGKDWRQEEKGTTEDRQDGCMASRTQWIWVWANSRRLWKTGKPGVLQSRGHKEPDITEQLNNTRAHLIRI